MNARQHSDVLILGAGPAGLAAAQAAAPSGLSTVLVDDNPLPGGQIWRTGPGYPSEAQARSQALAQYRNVQVHSGTRCVAVQGQRQLLLENAQGAWVQTFQKLILCSGARELLLPFPGWTLPGVTGAGGLQALIKGGVPVKGQRVVVAGSGPLLLAAAHTAASAGATLLRVAEQAGPRALLALATGLWRWPTKLRQAITLGTPTYRPGSQVLEALGNGRLEAVRIRQGSREYEIACDRLACGYGLVPNTELAQALGMALHAAGAIAVDNMQASSLGDHYAAGECTGIGGCEKALAEGAIAGYAATGQTEEARALQQERAHWHAFAAHLHRHLQADVTAVKALARPDTVVCRCEDVTFGELDGRAGWIDAKLHTRCGMGPCQGRVCGAAAIRLWGWNPPPVRQLLSPVRIDSLLGDSRKP
jgi:NADPH-dependent 2,4-dienoyl-CoA reductase/sulfur reductase-like enzyme